MLFFSVPTTAVDSVLTVLEHLNFLEALFDRYFNKKLVVCLQILEVVHLDMYVDMFRLYLKIVLGSVNVSLLSKHDKYVPTVFHLWVSSIHVYFIYDTFAFLYLLYSHLIRFIFVIHWLVYWVICCFVNSLVIWKLLLLLCRFRYKEDYELFKLYVTIVTLILASVICFFVDFRFAIDYALII